MSASPHGDCPRCDAPLLEARYGLRVDGTDDAWSYEAGCVIEDWSPGFICSACGLGLGRVHIDRLVPAPFAPRQKGTFSSWRRYQWAVLRFLDLERQALNRSFWDLAVPQRSCCINFGIHGLPLPAGALLRIWERDPQARPACPKCAGPGRAEGFGGLLNVGGYMCICMHCGHGWLNQMGGLGKMAIRVRPLLEGTPWFSKSTRFGGVYEDSGRELGRALGLPGWRGKSGGAKVELRAGTQRFYLDGVES